MATLPVQLDEENMVREEIAHLALPRGVKFQRVETGSDWTGEPAVRIYFSVSKSIPLTKKRVSAIASFSRSVVDRVLDLKLGKWPFVHFLDVK